MCDAGRSAFFGGRWIVPCVNPARHFISSPGVADEIKLCEQHFLEIFEAGLVDEPNIGAEEYERRRDLPPTNKE